MSHSFVAVLIFIVFAVAVLLYDFIIWQTSHGSSGTISALLNQWSLHYPIIAIVAGVLVGHLFGAGTPRGLALLILGVSIGAIFW